MKNRWLQLTLGIICMVMIANLQYGWTLFVLPIQHAHPSWAKSAIQVAFTAFVLCETWLLPIEGYIIDRIGPRLTVLAGGIMIGASWIADSYVNTLPLLYAASALGGVGSGFIYGATVGNAIRWFPDRRGLAAGLTAAGFGAGSAVTLVPVSNMIAGSGYQHTFLFFGVLQGVVVILVSLLLRNPPGVGGDHHAAVSAGGMVALRPSRLHELTHDFTPGEVARTPIFWLMYLMFVLVGAGGLMATAQLSVIATDFGVAKTPVTLLFLTMPALTYALAIDRVLNGLTRPFFGWVSDQIGRENTMFIAFLLEGLGIYILTRFASDPLAFVVVTGLVFFAWGEIYSLFPATCGDTFGRRFAATNYGLLYTAKGTAALLVPYGNTIRDATGSWLTVLYVAAALNILAAFLAMFVLKPMRRRFIRRSMEIRARARIEAGMEQAGMDEVGLEGNETLAEADVERRGAAILAFGALVLLLGAGALFAWESPPQVPARIADSSLAATAAAGPKAVPVAKPAAAPPVPAVGALAPGAQPATVPAATGPNATPQSPASPAAPAQGGPAQPAPAAKLALAAPQPTPPVQTTPQPQTPQPTASQPAGAPLQPAQPAIVAKPAPVPVALPPPPPPPPPPVEPDMISVRGGRFRMGSTENPTELPVHVVTVAAFKLSRTAVTLKEWSACVAAHVCKPVAEGAPDQPVTNVTWDEAQAYAVWLSASTEQHYRLPTEAEWEYAARAGTKTRYSWGNKMLPGRASCKGCGTEQDPNEPPAVAKYPPNPFGFYDMGGGVSEWVADCWHDSYAGAPANGNVAWSKPGCDEHVLRGGAWIESANALRVSARENFLGSIRDVSHGFRLAMSQ